MDLPLHKLEEHDFLDNLASHQPLFIRPQSYYTQGCWLGHGASVGPSCFGCRSAVHHLRTIEGTVPFPFLTSHGCFRTPSDRLGGLRGGSGSGVGGAAFSSGAARIGVSHASQRRRLLPRAGRGGQGQARDDPATSTAAESDRGFRLVPVEPQG
ncbi:hypothetical protein XA68_11416 [Ophiocordyceps unilateralis]|uniref:Uncharacterized protein n=1 Tax=Ophiocordyceps unilateralis TaxID=268505 RepID=A0A2A9PPP3_OPHUN|nr:hypothetical protein XA68_11416 [Ophiocordyceps unilateralis]